MLKLKINTNIIKKAVDVAKKSNVVRSKVGAVLYTDSGHILTYAPNVIYMGHKTKWTIHAEEFVLAKALKLRIMSRYDVNNLGLLVIRFRQQDGAITCAKPCEKCQELIRQANISVVYSDYDGLLKRLVFNGNS